LRVAELPVTHPPQYVCFREIEVDTLPMMF